MLLLSVALAAPMVAPAPPNALDLGFTATANEFGVPRPLLMAIGYEATRWNPDVVSDYGGVGMFGLLDGDGGEPSLEHAAALIETDPNLLISDWRAGMRGTAALLAWQAQLSNGGVLPPTDDLGAWWPAVVAFSGRQEPNLQALYGNYIYSIVQDGVEELTRWGPVRIEPQSVSLPDVSFAPPPPPATDSSLAYQYYAACSSNYSDYSRGSGDIDMVVIHTTQGSYSGSISWFANCSSQVSAHYTIRSSDGQITQSVREADVAWHAGHWDTNERSIGIEHEGYVEDPDTWYTDAMYRASAALTADIAARQGVTLSRSYIIAHAEVPGCSSGSGGGSGCHTDPGSGWDWDYYMDLVTGSGGVAGGEIIGVVADSDISNGTRLPGATVWIEQTGETTTADGYGVYRFEEVPFGTYTMHATAPGYDEGTCTKTTTGTQEWCSIALFPSSDTDPDTTVTDSGDPGTDPGVTDSTPTGPDGGRPPGLPGELVPGEEVGGCAAGGRAASAWWLLAVPLLMRRRGMADRGGV